MLPSPVLTKLDLLDLVFKEICLRQALTVKVMALTTIYEKKGGHRVKTDRRGARKLSKALHWGAFKEVVALSVEDEATRDYVRMRDDRKNALKKAKQQLKSFLLKKNKHYLEKGVSWTIRYRTWLRSITFELSIDQQTYDEYHAEIYRLEEVVEQLYQCGVLKTDTLQLEYFIQCP